MSYVTDCCFLYPQHSVVLVMFLVKQLLSIITL